jgi:hypothetical protein
MSLGYIYIYIYENAHVIAYLQIGEVLVGLTSKRTPNNLSGKEIISYGCG